MGVASANMWQFYLAQGLVLVGVLIGYAQTRRDRRQDEMKRIAHGERLDAKLEILVEFHRTQTEFNRNRDTELTELKIQSAKLTEIATAMSKRLDFLETNKLITERRRQNGV